MKYKCIIKDLITKQTKEEFYKDNKKEVYNHIKNKYLSSLYVEMYLYSYNKKTNDYELLYVE